MAAPIRTVTDLVPYLDGTPMDGHATSVTVETIEFNKSEENRLGLIGTPKVFMKFDPIIVSITWRSLMQEWAEITANPLNAYLLQLRGNISEDDASGNISDVPTVIEITGISDSHSMMDVEREDGSEFETSFSCTKLVQTIDGAPIIDFDLYSYQYSVGGTDLMEAKKANLGI